MNSKDPAMRWVVVFLAIIAIVQVAGFASSLGEANSESKPSSGAVGGEPNSVDERMVVVLERIEQLLDSSQKTPLNTPAMNSLDRRTTPGPGGTLSRPSMDDLVRALDQLRVSIENDMLEMQEIVRSAPGFGGASMLKLRDEKENPDWIALEELEQSWHANPEAANRSQYFLTPKDLLKRYGPPTAIYRPQGGLNFYYRKHPSGESGPTWSFRVTDGIVVGFVVAYE